MQFEKIQCLLRLNQGGNLNLSQIVKSGPDALTAPEVPILRMMHEAGEGTCAVTEAKVVGTVERSKADELTRLREKYGRKVVDACYPGGRAVPSTMADCELPPESLAKVDRKSKVEAMASKVEA